MAMSTTVAGLKVHNKERQEPHRGGQAMSTKVCILNKRETGVVSAKVNEGR